MMSAALCLILAVAIPFYGTEAAVTCWNARCQWDALKTVRESCTLEAVGQCTGAYCISHFESKTVEALQCVDNLPTLSGVESCDHQDKCICSTTVLEIACSNISAPSISLSSGGSGNVIEVAENTAVGTIVAQFDVVHDPSLSSTLKLKNANPDSFGDFFSFSKNGIEITNPIDYEPMKGASSISFRLEMVASVATAVGNKETTSEFTLKIIDVNEAPKCTDSSGNTIANNTAVEVQVDSKNAPLSQAADIYTISCADPDAPTNFREMRSEVISGKPSFHASCADPDTSGKSRCKIKASAGTEFFYNSRTGYTPVWVISQPSSSFSLTTTASISVTYKDPGISFKQGKPGSFTFNAPTWPLTLPQEVFDFGTWVDVTSFQSDLGFSLCNALDSNFTLSAYTGKLSLVSEKVVSGKDYSVCVKVTAGPAGAVATWNGFKVKVITNEPPAFTWEVQSDIGKRVPRIAIEEVTVFTVTPKVTSGDVSRFVFSISEFIYEFDTPAFYLKSTNNATSLVMRRHVETSKIKNQVKIKIIAVGHNPSIQKTEYTDLIDINKDTASNTNPIIDPAQILDNLRPSEFSDNSLIGEFYAYLYRGGGSIKDPEVTFSDSDLFYATVAYSEKVAGYWHKHSVKIWSYPGSTFDMGPFDLTITVKDGSKTATYTTRVEPVNTYLALDSHRFTFCYSCDNCDIAFVGVAQRCGINETFCCSRAQPGSRTSRYCSSILDFSDIVTCCFGKLCNVSPMFQSSDALLYFGFAIFFIRAYANC